MDIRRCKGCKKRGGFLCVVSFFEECVWKGVGDFM